MWVVYYNSMFRRVVDQGLFPRFCWGFFRVRERGWGTVHNRGRRGTRPDRTSQGWKPPQHGPASTSDNGRYEKDRMAGYAQTDCLTLCSAE
jgi:hypothetical protein